MQTIKVSDDLTITRYDSIKEMPADLYQVAKQYEILAAELATGESELFEMLSRAQSYARAGQIAEFDEQLHNYQLARDLSLERFQPGQLDWACHVKAWNGNVIDDYSEETLMSLIVEWSKMGLTQQLIESTFADVKKKFSDELTRYFPRKFGRGGSLNQLDQVRRYLIAQIKNTLTPSDITAQQLSEAFGLLIGHSKPIKLRESNNDLVQMEKSYSKLCVTLAECDCPNPKALTVFELYTWLESLEEKFEKLKKQVEANAAKRK